MATPIDEEINKQIEQAHQEWINALDAIEYPIFLHDKEFRILRCNHAYQQHTGKTFKEIIGRPYYEFFPKSDAPMRHCAEALEHPSDKGSEEEIKVGDRIFFSRGVIVNDKNGHYLYSLHILKDITEQQQTIAALQQSEEKFNQITSSAQDAILMMDESGNIVYWNKAAETMFSYEAEEVIGKNLHLLITPERFHEAHRQGFEHFKQTGESPVVGKTIELWALNKQGDEFPIELSLSIARFENGWNAIGIIRDITARKKAENALERANRALKTLSAGNMALVRAKNESDLLQEVANVIVEQAGYSLAVVVYAKENPQKSIVPIAAAGMIKEGKYDWADQITWEDTPNGQLPVSLAIRNGLTQVCHNIACAIGFKQWKESALSEGYMSNIALPLSNGKKTFGALCIYSTEESAFDDEEVKLLEELANDLAYGIINLRTRIQQEEQSTLLRESLEQSIQTIAATVEARDPYTAGHQRRVAELATAIAQEMKLNEEQIQGIHFAAIIHDLGKIHIPAEILAKPGKLSAIEFMLIQTHPQEGYEILKEVKFPWPIAETILQHHEKLDGSGYPRGLRGDEICLEARILTVADVVEAMYSHRPYRAAVGIQAALNEIRHGRGTWYDEAVVDACLRLFEEYRFEFNTIAM